MEIAGDAAPSGGCSIRDLPPSKRFKFVGSKLGSAPCLPLPAKKRAFPPLPDAAPVPVCLPAKKRAYALAVAEDAVMVCLPAKKRAYAPPLDDISPARLPAKTSVHVNPRPPPEVAVPPPAAPSRKSVQVPAPQKDATAPLSVLANKRVQMLSRPVAATAAPSVPVKKRVQTLSPLRNAGAPPTVPAKKRVQAPSLPEGTAASLSAPAKKRVQAPSLPEGTAASLSAPAKKLFQVPRRTEAATAAPAVQAKKRVQAPSPTEVAAAPLSVPAKKPVQVPSGPEAAPSVEAKKRVQASSRTKNAAARLSDAAKQRVLAPSCPDRAVDAPSVPAKQRVVVPSCPERTVTAPSVPAKQRLLVAAASFSTTASKRVPSPPAPEDASALFPVCLPANKRVMSQFIPPSPSPSMKSDGDRVAAAKEASSERSVKPGGATNPAVANGAGACPRAEASKMQGKPNEVKDLVVMKSRRAKNTARKASDLHCKKLSDVISGMQSEVQAEVPKTFEQASDVHSKKLSDVVNGMQSDVQAEVLETFEQASDVHCKKLPNDVNGKHSEVQDEVLKTLEQGSDVHFKKLSNAVQGKHCEVQAEELKAFEQPSDLHCQKLSDVVNGKHSEVQDEALKRLDHSVDPKVAVPASKEEPRKEDEVAGEPKEDYLAEEEEDDGVLCAVCRSTDGDPSDPIVFCDGCDLMVHAACYGNPLAQSIPEGDWFCSLCSDKATATSAKKGKPARPPCRLCPSRGGAMKRTTDGAWAHISCALLVPEVFFQDPDGRDAIDCSLVPARRFTKHCYICESSRGCALECSQPKCDLGFHVSCGLNGGLCIEYREQKGGGVVAGFCREHTILWEKQQLTGKYKIVSRGH